MWNNVGPWDRTVRWLLALGLVGMIGLGLVRGAQAWMAAIAAVILFVTGAARACPVYRMFGVRTSATPRPRPHG